MIVMVSELKGWKKVIKLLEGEIQISVCKYKIYYSIL